MTVQTIWQDFVLFFSILQELGYQSEIGYQTFLYSSENDIRRVFMFLIEKLPKEAAEATEETLGMVLLFITTISLQKFHCTIP